jgi:hypothetical protein
MKVRSTSSITINLKTSTGDRSYWLFYQVA